MDPNITTSTSNRTVGEYYQDKSEIIIQGFWLTGIVVSILCFLVQGTIFILIRGSRKTDEKILAHITFTRILVTCCEYYILYIEKSPNWIKDFTFGLYFTCDFATVAWMLVFTKHLYDKILVVFNTLSPNLVIVTTVVYVVSLPFGIIAVCLLNFCSTGNENPSFEFFNDLVYVVIKFVIQSFNSLIYIRVFYVAIRRGEANSKNVRSIIKTAVVAFLLITTTCIQILVTDIISVLNNTKTDEKLIKWFCVINSFHAVPLTAIFIVILKGKMRQSITKTVTVRLKELVT